jgi:serine/threonine protein kinase
LKIDQLLINNKLFKNDIAVNTKLDVWAAGVILFALLCGRLPFDGSDLTYEDRPDDSIVFSRIVVGTYEIEPRLTTGAKDLLKRMLCVDPEMRATVPEVQAHHWLANASALTDAVLTARIARNSQDKNPSQAQSSNSNSNTGGVTVVSNSSSLVQGGALSDTSNTARRRGSNSLDKSPGIEALNTGSTAETLALGETQGGVSGVEKTAAGGMNTLRILRAASNLRRVSFEDELDRNISAHDQQQQQQQKRDSTPSKPVPVVQDKFDYATAAGSIKAESRRPSSAAAIRRSGRLSAGSPILENISTEIPKFDSRDRRSLSTRKGMGATKAPVASTCTSSSSTATSTTTTARGASISGGGGGGVSGGGGGAEGGEDDGDSEGDGLLSMDALQELMVHGSLKKHGNGNGSTRAASASPSPAPAFGRSISSRTGYDPAVVLASKQIIASSSVTGLHALGSGERSSAADRTSSSPMDSVPPMFSGSRRTRSSTFEAGHSSANKTAGPKR